MTFNNSNLQELLCDDTIPVCKSKSLNILSSENIHQQDHNMPYSHNSLKSRRHLFIGINRLQIFGFRYLVVTF
jgi:hypothetical protein